MNNTNLRSSLPLSSPPSPLSLLYTADHRRRSEKERSSTYFFFLCRFLRSRFLRLWVDILCRFLFFPLGITTWIKV